MGTITFQNWKLLYSDRVRLFSYSVLLAPPSVVNCSTYTPKGNCDSHATIKSKFSKKLYKYEFAIPAKKWRQNICPAILIVD